MAPLVFKCLPEQTLLLISNVQRFLCSVCFILEISKRIIGYGDDFNKLLFTPLFMQICNAL